MVLAVIAGFLALDQGAAPSQQLLLGLATWVILLCSCAPLDPEERARVGLVVAVATCAEVLGSVVLGIYVYRLENLPAFVPPGHGLVYLAGLRISQSGPVRRHRGAFVAAAIAVVGAWGLAGLALLSRTDVLGALAGAALVFMLVRRRNGAAALYAGVFAVVAFLELYGTAVGAWRWSEVVPGSPLPAGNPPSGIASVYVLFDIAAIALAPRLLAMADGCRLRFAGRGASFVGGRA